MRGASPKPQGELGTGPAERELGTGDLGQGTEGREWDREGKLGMGSWDRDRGQGTRGQGTGTGKWRRPFPREYGNNYEVENGVLTCLVRILRCSSMPCDSVF